MHRTKIEKIHQVLTIFIIRWYMFYSIYFYNIYPQILRVKLYSLEYGKVKC